MHPLPIGSGGRLRAAGRTPDLSTLGAALALAAAATTTPPSIGSPPAAGPSFGEPPPVAAQDLDGDGAADPIRLVPGRRPTAVHVELSAGGPRVVDLPRPLVAIDVRATRDRTGDGVRELLVRARPIAETFAGDADPRSDPWTDPAGRMTLLLDVADARVRGGLTWTAAIVRDGGDPGDGWSRAGLDRTGDGRVDIADLVDRLAGATPAGTSNLAADLRSLLDAWSPDQVAEGGVPLACSGDCLFMPCPGCIGGWCCRALDGSMCGVCFGGGDRDPPDRRREPNPGDPSTDPDPGGDPAAPLPPGVPVTPTPDPGSPPGRPCGELAPIATGPDDEGPGRVRLGATRRLRLEADAACSIRWSITGPACFVDAANGDCLGPRASIDAGDDAIVRFTGCGTVVLSPGGFTCPCPEPPDDLVFEVYAVDLDLDSDGDDALGPPSRSAEEDAAEDDAASGLPLILTSAGDPDGDGLPAWIDGLRPDAGPEAAFELRTDTPVALSLPAETIPGLEVRFEYDASDPAALPAVLPDDFEGRVPPLGTWRLWRRAPGVPGLDRRDLDAGGDFIRPGVWYPREVLGQDGAAPEELDLALEAVHPDRDRDRSRVRVTIRFAGGRPPEDIELDEACGFDTVHAHAAALRLDDLRHWGPRYDAGSIGLVDLDPWRPVAGHERVAGAIADGTSLVIVRLDPPPLGHALAATRLRVEGRRHGGEPVHPAAVAGVVVPAAAAGDLLAPPAVPLVEVPGPATAAFDEGAAYYVPPAGILRDRGSRLPVIDELERVSVPMLLSLEDGDGRLLGHGMLRLREPPLVRVHGILSSAATAWHAPWDGFTLRRIRDADWSEVLHGGRDGSLEGVEEAFGLVARSIDAAIWSMRLGADLPARYAATRADVVAHSAGGVLMKWYAADLPPGALARVSGYPDLIIERHPPLAVEGVDPNDDGRWPFLRADNWGAGPVNRLVTIGSPQRGSVLAAIAAPLFGPTPAQLEALEVARSSGFFVRAGLEEILWPDGVTYAPPTILADLAPGSPAMNRMDPVVANYPVGHRGVARLAIGTVWRGPPQGLRDAVAARALVVLLSNDARHPDAPFGLLDLVQGVRTMIRLLGVDAAGDGVVRLRSQLDMIPGPAVPPSRRVLDRIAHATPLDLLAPETQLRSLRVIDDVRRSLQGSRSLFELAPGAGDLPGVRAGRRRHAFGVLGGD